MTLKTLSLSTVLTATALLTAPAAAQYGGSSIGVNFGGAYSKTTVTGPNGKSASIRWVGVVTRIVINGGRFNSIEVSQGRGHLSITDRLDYFRGDHGRQNSDDGENANHLD